MYDLISRDISSITLMAAFELSRQQAGILRRILWHEYSNADSLTEFSSTPSVAVHRLKVRLAKFEITIATRRGLGYTLDRDMRNKLLGCVDDHRRATLKEYYSQELPA